MRFGDLDIDRTLPAVQWVFEHPDWEASTFDVIDRFAPKTFVDVGAWVGIMSIYAALHGAEVVALEPDPVAFQNLDANVYANMVHQQVFYRWQAALWSHDDGTDLYAQRFGNSMTGPSIRGKQFRATTISPQTLADRTGPVDLIKCDAEGSESEFIPGLLAAYPTTPILLSVHTPMFVTPGELDYLDRTVEMIDKGDGAHHTVLLLP